MNVSGGIKGFAIGMGVDLLMGGVTGGMASVLGGIYGLFRPDAKSMDAAYDGSRFTDAPRTSGDLGIFSSILGNSEGRPNDPRAVDVGGRDTGLWKKVGAVAIGLGLFSGVLGNFGLPLYAAGMIPYNAGGLLPLAWSSGALPSWGWGAGIWC